MDERRITDAHGREWLVTRSLRSGRNAASCGAVRAGCAGLHFRCGSECREARFVVSDLGQLSDSELLAALWGAEPCGPEGKATSGMVWNVVRRSA